MMMMDTFLFHICDSVRSGSYRKKKKEEGGRGKKKILRRFERSQMAGWLDD